MDHHDTYPPKNLREMFLFLINNLVQEHFLSKMPLKPPWPPQLPESSPRELPESPRKCPRCLPDASEIKKNLFGFWHQGYWYSFNFQKAWSMMSPFIQPVNCFESNLVLNHILNVGCWVGGRQGGPQGGQCQQNLTNQWGHTGGGKTPLHPSCGGCEVVARPQSNLGL